MNRRPLHQKRTAKSKHLQTIHLGRAQRAQTRHFIRAPAAHMLELHSLFHAQIFLPYLTSWLCGLSTLGSLVGLGFACAQANPACPRRVTGGCGGCRVCRAHQPPSPYCVRLAGRLSGGPRRWRVRCGAPVSRACRGNRGCRGVPVGLLLSFCCGVLILRYCMRARFARGVVEVGCAPWLPGVPVSHVWALRAAVVTA
jgi:hypothetical protein